MENTKCFHCLNSPFPLLPYLLASIDYETVTYLILPRLSNDDFMSLLQVRESALSLPGNAGGEFRECSMVCSGVVTAIDVFSRRAAPSLAGSLTLYFAPPSSSLLSRPGPLLLASASRSFLTQPCSALLRRNRHSTCGRDGDSIIFIKSSFGGSTEAINSDESLRLSPILSGLENKLCFIDEKAVW